MEYRLLELIIPHDHVEEARQIVQEQDPIGVWSDQQGENHTLLRILVDVDQIESMSDTLSNSFSGVDGFRIMLFTVEATLPRTDRDEERDEPDKEQENDEETENTTGRISREELYAEVSGGSELSKVYISLVILSTLVAGAGLIRGDVAVIIGAMVIAPLLGPNVSLSLAATLGDTQLAWRSLKTGAVGLFASLGVALALGLFLTIDTGVDQIINRTQVSLGDITIALAAGSAGVLAYTRGVSEAVVGVMVAVALLPPLVVVGLLLGSGYTGLAMGATILTLTNLICINLAGVATFLVQGIRPRNWWQAKKAKKASRIALATWLVLLVIFAVIIWLWGQS